MEKTAARQPSIDEIMDRVKAAKAAGMSAVRARNALTGTFYVGRCRKHVKFGR